MGIPESTVRKCMAETGKTGAVALTHCIKKAEERKYSNPSPFFYREKEYSMFTECCREFNLEPNKVRQKSISLNSSLQDALDFFLLDHPVRRKNFLMTIILLNRYPQHAGNMELKELIFTII